MRVSVNAAIMAQLTFVAKDPRIYATISRDISVADASGNHLHHKFIFGRLSREQVFKLPIVLRIRDDALARNCVLSHRFWISVRCNRYLDGQEVWSCNTSRSYGGVLVKGVRKIVMAWPWRSSMRGRVDLLAYPGQSHRIPGLSFFSIAKQIYSCPEQA